MNTFKLVDFTEEECKNFSLLLLSYVNGYVSRFDVLRAIDMYGQNRYLAGQLDGLRSSNAKIKEIFKNGQTD